MHTITKLLTIIALVATTTPIWAQDYKTREVPNAPAFTAIDARGGDVNVAFEQGPTHAFAVSGPAKLVKSLKIKVKDNTLFIDYNEPFFSGDDNDIYVRITAPQINRISVSGEADFECKTPFQGKELTITTRQNGEVSMKNVAVGQINIDAKGSSSVDLDYLQSNKITLVAVQDRADVELSGTTGQLEMLKQKGFLAELDTEHLIVTNAAGSHSAPAGQVAADGSVEFSF